MILHEIAGGTEDHPAYRELQVSNSQRHYSFLKSVVTAALQTRRYVLSQTVIKALNYHAIACLHSYAGEYRPCKVVVGEYRPPEHFRVKDLMDEFVNTINRDWNELNTIELASYVLWRLNYIHPFINGNGRTARALCYYTLGINARCLLPGNVILPELLLRERAQLVEALRHATRSFEQARQGYEENPVDLDPLGSLILDLLEEQLASQ